VPENWLATLQLSQLSCVGKEYVSINLCVILLHRFYIHKSHLYLFVSYRLCVICYIFVDSPQVRKP